MSGVTTFSLSLACSLRNWVILDYEEANGLTIRPWAPFLLYLFSFLFLCAQGHCAVASVIKDSISSSLSLMDGRVRFTSYAWPSIDREDKRTGVHHWWHFLFFFSYSPGLCLAHCSRSNILLVQDWKRKKKEIFTMVS